MGNHVHGEVTAERDHSFADRVAAEMKKYFHTDFRRIDHASKVAFYADKLAIEEKADPAVVMPAAYLHDIGIKEAERKYNSTAARYQHEKGPPIARKILEDLNATEELVVEVWDIVGHHHNPRPEESTNFKALYDADLIVNIEDNLRTKKISAEAVRKLVTKRFLTSSGKKMALAMFIPSKNEV